MKARYLFGMAAAWLCLSASAGISDVLDFTADSLPADHLGRYNADISQSSVSGLSAGAYMADQFFVAFSKDMLGAGLFAGGPYGCSNGDLSTALGRCMSPTFADRIDATALQQLYAKAQGYAAQGKIDALENLRSKTVYIFSGTQDITVKPEVTDWVDDWYQTAGVPAANLFYKDDLVAPHALPTMDYGTSCPTPGNPWMSDCDYDGAGAALTQIFGTLNPPNPTSELSGKFIKFHQNEFFEPGILTAQELKTRYSMNEFGFAYVPKACLDGQQCKIHVVFHGCKQVYNRNPEASDFSPEDASTPFGLQFVKYAGYNEWADTNNLIIIYPQAQKVQATNPRGCFDWWGYLPGTRDTYPTKQGPQMKAVYAMLERAAEGPSPACEGANQPPTIALAGQQQIEIQVGDTLALPDPEATASDPEDGDITANIVRTPAGALDTSQAGTYTLRYNVEDSEGCMANEVIRTVIVTGCRQWTASNAVHATERRAERGWCFWLFFPYRCYVAKGSRDALGTGSLITTVKRENPGTEHYEKGECR
jgi:poly(3-hydroxybutyrate) depolymerase